MSNQNDGLFLLEVLIDKIVFVKSPCFSDKDFRTCVNIECPAVEPLEICDDDPGACIAKNGGPFVKTFNNGKSCLFSLKESDISSAMSKFPVKVTVYKSLPCGCLPTKIIMGECTIDMTKEFVEARNKFLEDPTNVSFQALKDSFRIVGPDSTETGEIVMFLRISCFGKLIVTRFQGSGAPPNLGTGAGGTSAVVDRSCNPRKDFQSANEPCVCGATHGLGGGGGGASGGPPCAGGGGGRGVCPIAGDPYNKMPCEDPDDPCYCSGPKLEGKPPMVCRNTDQYCLHVPKGSLLCLPIYRESTDLQKDEFDHSSYEKRQLVGCSKELSTRDLLFNSLYQASNNYNIRVDYINILQKPYVYKTLANVTDSSSIISPHNLSLKRNSNVFSKLYYNSKLRVPCDNVESVLEHLPCTAGLFGLKETTAYMTLFDDYCRHRTSGTQATASINKCFQVYSTTNQKSPSSFSSNSEYSSCTTSTTPYRCGSRPSDRIRFSEVYFFGRKKEDTKQKGMGQKESKSYLCKSGQSKTPAVKSEVKNKESKPHVSITTSTTSTGSPKRTPQRKVRGASTGTSTSKSVSIKDEKSLKPCPALGTTKGDMMATVSHIKIGPKETCPVHGKEPCQGPKCIVAASGEEQGPIKVTSVNNPRRGVFELVIRKMTGAPLAKNELMLEWTPPPSRPPPCGSPCPISCSPPGPCRPSKCKLVVFRPSPCKSRCTKKKSCGPISCRPVPCKRCCKASCCGKPCRPCKPCPPPRCSPCPPSPCKSPCTPITCKSPCMSCCKSSPCLRPCPVGRKRARRARSQPRIRSHRKRISPCWNRSKACPVVRCRSVPGPCIGCCGVPPFCLPRKCCSVSPCKPPKCCKSNCSTCYA